MFTDAELLPISALQHLAYCPRQCALIHLEQSWIESKLTAEGRLLHEKSHREQTQRKGSQRIARGAPLRSLILGIAGQADVVEFHSSSDGDVAYPIEYKRGRPKSHEADRIQLCAQALCLEEMLGKPVPTGAIFYGKIRRRMDVIFDEPLRQLTLRTIQQLRELFARQQTPPARYDKGKCERCSLKRICMPGILQGSESASRYLSRSIAQMLAQAPADDWEET